MRAFLVLLLSAGWLFGQVNPRALVRQSIANGERSWTQSFSYSCLKRDIDRQFNSNGKVRSREDDLYRVIPLGYNTSYDEIIEQNGEPVSADQKQKAEAELERRQAESPAQKRRRFRKDLNARSYMKEVADAFNFRIVGREKLPTGMAWVLEATPRPGFQPRSRYAHAFPKMRGKLWIDQKDVQWVKADAISMDTVTFGFFIARLAKGSHIIIEQQKLPDGDWVPKSISAKASARTFVFFNHNFDEEITYTDYKKSADALSARR
ncbi:MAG TPA: hypothetical protein VG675_16585 [Bryobacteraceae bacterium]|nr:hypothetical protein [Bryobacteraceae bacterium]